MIKPKLLSLILCIELLLSPLGLGLVQSTTVSAEAYGSCRTGYEFKQGRCILSKTTSRVKNSAIRCGELPKDQQAACFDKNVKLETSKAKIKGSQKLGGHSMGAYGVEAIVTAGAGYYLYNRQDALKGCSSTSMWLLLGGALTSIVGEFMAQNKYQKDTKALANAYTRRVASANAAAKSENAASKELLTQNQFAAYDFQIQQEEAKQKAHKARKTTYMLGAGLYSASAVAALIEAYSTGGIGGCSGDEGQAKKDAEIERGVDEHENVINSETTTTDLKTSIIDEQNIDDKINGHINSNILNPTPYEGEIDPNGNFSKPAIEQKIEEKTINDKINDQIYKIKNQSNTRYEEKNNPNGSYIRKDNVDTLMASSPMFKEYHYIRNFTASEVLEVIARNIFNIISSTQAATGETTGPDVSGQCSQETGTENFTNVPCPTISSNSADISNSNTETNSGNNTGALAGAVTPALGFLSKAKLAASTVGSTMNKAIRLPIARAAIGGVLAGYSLTVANKAGAEAKLSGKKIAFLKELKNNFFETNGAGYETCSAADRRNPSRVACYCYTSSGKPDKTKERMTRCASVFGKNYTTPNETAYSKYYGPATQGRSCMTKQMKSDPTCKCKDRKTKGGENNCLKLSTNLSLGSLASSKALVSTVRDAASLVSGKTGTGSLNPAPYKRLFSTMKNAKDTLLKQRDPKGAVKFARLERKIRKSFTKSAAKAAQSGALKDLASGFGASSASSPKTAAEVMAKSKKDLASIQRAGTSYGTSTKNGGMNFDFGDDDANEGGIEIDNDIASAMKADYVYDDISKNKGGSIFQIITNRYHTSGLRVFFNTNENTKPEAPNETEINDK